MILSGSSATAGLWTLTTATANTAMIATSNQYALTISYLPPYEPGCRVCPGGTAGALSGFDPRKRSIRSAPGQLTPPSGTASCPSRCRRTPARRSRWGPATRWLRRLRSWARCESPFLSLLQTPCFNHPAARHRALPQSADQPPASGGHTSFERQTTRPSPVGQGT